MYILDECKLTEREYNWLRSYLGWLALCDKTPQDVKEHCDNIGLKLDALATVIAALPPSYI